MSEIVQLPVKPRPKAQCIDKPAQPQLFSGQMTRFGGDVTSQLAGKHGIVGNYQLSTDAAEITSPSLIDGHTEAYLWDGDSALNLDIPWQQQQRQHITTVGCQLAGNHASLQSVELSGPDILQDEQQAQLHLEAHWQLALDSSNFAAELGLITLVDSQRFITLESGKQITITDTQESDTPVLYLGQDENLPIVTPITHQAQGEQQQHAHTTRIQQSIPDEHEGEIVESVTVLEQFHSYFMQKPMDDKSSTIWIPLLAPLRWGWSIRVGRRADGPWCIVRRKLIMPTMGHDGLELPLWEANQLQYTRQALL